MENEIEKIALEKENKELKVKNLVYSRFTSFLLNNPPEVFDFINDFDVFSVNCMGAPWYSVMISLKVRYLGVSFFKDLEEYLGHSFVIGSLDGKLVISYTAKYEKV